MNKNYDVVIIGAGLNTFTAANLLAKKENKKVLVLDHNYFSGGYAISFEKQGDKVDISLHHTDGLLGEVKTLSRDKTIFFIFEISFTISELKKELMEMGFVKENILCKQNDLQRNEKKLMYG